MAETKEKKAIAELQEDGNFYPLLVVSMLISVLLSITALIVILLDKNIPKQYQYLYVLPLGHILISFIPLVSRLKGSLTFATLIVYWLYTIRNALTPLLLPLSSYDSVMTSFDSRQCLYGISLMLYETLIVFIGCNYITPNYKRVSRLNNYNVAATVEVNPFKGSIYGLVVLALFLFFLYGYIRIPQLRDTYYSIWQSSSYYAGERLSRDLEEAFYGSGTNRNLYVVCKYIQKYLIFVISVWVIDKLYAAYSKRKLRFWFYLSLMVIPAQFIFMSDANLASFIAAYCLLYTIWRIYPEYKKGVMVFFFSIAIAALVLIMINRFMNADVSNYAKYKPSAFLQSYLPGVSNFACIFNLKSHEIPGKFQTLFYDFISGLPFKGSFFGNDDYKLSIYYNSLNDTRGQILPCVGQFAYYVTPVFAPFLCLIYVRIAQTSLVMAKKATTALEITAYVLLFVYSVINSTTNNTTNYISLVVQRVVPLFILGYFRRIRI